MRIPTWWDIQNVLSTTGQDDDYYTAPEKESLKHQATQELGMWGVALCLVSALFMSAGLSLQKMVSQRAALDPSFGPADKQSMYRAGVGYVSLGFFMRMLVHTICCCHCVPVTPYPILILVSHPH